MKMNNHLTGALPAEFFGSAGHELRNPLATVIAQAEMLLDEVHGPLSAPQTAALRSIHEHTRQTCALITSLVDLARLQTESLTLNPCDVSDAAENALSQISKLASSRSIQFSGTLYAGLYAMADKSRLAQMLDELLAAAALMTPSGGQVQFHVTTEAGGILIQAIGNACMPPPQDGAPNSVLQQLNKLRPIGLALLETLVRLHQGQFTVNAATGHASIFTLRLPATSQTTETAIVRKETSPAPSPPPRPAKPACTPLILIADDQTAFVSITCNYLESLGFQVATARDGEEAVRLALSLLPDLIFMDVCMPMLDGLSAIRQIRAAADSKLHTIPIISLSGGTGATDRENCLAAGATSYLGKPFGIREIDRIIQDFIPPAAS
jgi:CheY-like chemotaxis protein